MSRTAFFACYALIGLRRGGQRVVIALLAVAFGVMSLIAMSSVAATIDNTLNQDTVIQVGGDLRLTHPDGRFDNTALHLLDTLQAEGLIQQYSPVSETFALLMRTEQSGKAQFVFASLGVDPQIYPLAGELVIGAILLMPSAWPKLVILMLFVLMTSPTATHSIAQTAYRMGYHPGEVDHSVGNGGDSATPSPMA